MKNCQRQGKSYYFGTVLENADIACFYFHILSKDKSYQCCILLYRWQSGVREKYCKTVKSQGIVRENENLIKIMATLIGVMNS